LAASPPDSPKNGRRAFLMRVRPEVLAAVEHLAAAELRSVNAQVEMLLREALSRRGALRALDSGSASEEPPPP
jgi:hypothetical protein